MDKDALRNIIEHYKDFKVLYVEDETGVREQTLKLMKIYFKDIFVAGDGQEGLKIFKREKIDIVFTDINMPNMDGLAMIDEIRKINSFVPVIVFSAYDHPEYFLQTIRNGVVGYLLKPFKLEEIYDLLKKLYDQNRLGTNLQDKFSKLELIDGFYWDAKTQSLCKNSMEIVLSKHEIALFDLLTSSKSRVFSSEDIEIAVFDDDYSDNRRVRNLLSRLNAKIGTQLIQNIYGEGYRLKWRH
ncbi:MAG: response regulator [Campylobacter sp.]|nr:response regulator [Campylobacter sp.]